MTSPTHQEQHATANVVEYGKAYKAGEFLPFYVPRPFMPQLPESCYGRMIALATADHPSPPTIECIVPNELRAHQRVNRAIVTGMPELVKHKIVLISKDNYILDGNHRWWANVEDHCDYMNAIRIQLPFDDAIKWLLDLPWTYEVDVNGKMVAGPNDHQQSGESSNETHVQSS